MDEEDQEGFQAVRNRRQRPVHSIRDLVQRTRDLAVKGETMFAKSSLEEIIAFYAAAGFLTQNDQGTWAYSQPSPTKHELHAAVAHNRIDVLDFFLRAGSSPQSINDATGQWPHHVACELGNRPALEKLLEYLTIGNADFLRRDPRDNSGFNSLLLATQACNLDMITFLLGQGAKVNSKCNFGRNALHIVAGFVDEDIKKSDKMLGIPLDICKLLISKGIMVDRLDKAGITPVMLAVQRGNDDLLRLLVSHGADVDREAPNFHTATWKFNLSVREHIATHGPASKLSKAINYGVTDKHELRKRQEVEQSVERQLVELLPSRDICMLVLQFCQDDLGETVVEEVIAPAPPPKKKKEKKARIVSVPRSRRKTPIILQFALIVLAAYLIGGYFVVWLFFGS